MPSPRMVLSQLLLAGTVCVSTVLIGTLAAPAASAHSSSTQSHVTPVGDTVLGADAAWPNCPRGLGVPDRRTLGLPLPLQEAKFVILGVTNGYGFTTNPCLAAQVAWVKARHLWLGAYANNAYPSDAEIAQYGGTGTLGQRLVQTGRVLAATNVAEMRAAGLNAPMIWMDIEPSSARPWRHFPAAHNALIDGIYSGYRAAGLRVGIYSYSSTWRQITGNRQTPGVPAWIPAGRTNLDAALSRCRGVTIGGTFIAGTFNGGPAWLGQWTDNVRDFNVTCPGVTGTAPTMHPLTRYLGTTVLTGSRGPAVRALQRELALSADGIFGVRTTTAVLRFQLAKGLAVDGVVGPQTWRALGAGSSVPGRSSLLPLAFVPT